MRDKIFDYLENDLSPTERQAFERQLAIDPDLQAELVVQQDMMQKLHDAHLRQQAQAQLGNWKKHADEFKQHQFRKQVLIWGSIIGIAALAVWALFRYFEIFNETEVAQKPVFAQGEQAFQKYLKDSLIDKNREAEPVEVTFVVERDNSITNVKVLHCNNKAFEQEILRFIKTMPNWKAGRHKNKLVRVQMTISIPLPSKSQDVVNTLPNPNDLPVGAPTPTESSLPRALDSALRVPVRQLIGSESVLLARLENATQLKGNKNLQLLVHQYFTETNIVLPNETDSKLIAVQWLLRTMFFFEQGNANVSYHLQQIPSSFFEQEKAFYKELIAAPNHQNRLKNIILNLKSEPLNIHHEKCLQLKAFFATHQ